MSYSSVFSSPPPKLTTAQLRHLEIGIDATGVRPDTLVASAKADSHGTVLRRWEVTGVVSVIFSDILTTTESVESGYLNGNYSWVEFQPSFQPVALTDQLESIGINELKSFRYLREWYQKRFSIWRPSAIWDL